MLDVKEKAKYLHDVLEKLKAENPGAEFCIQMVYGDTTKEGFVAVHLGISDAKVVPLCIKNLVDNFTSIYADDVPKSKDKH